jgi:tight adherence protein C
MDIAAVLQSASVLWTPLTAAVLAGVAMLFIWLALAPARPISAVRTRLDAYLNRTDLVEDSEMRRPFANRVLAPIFRRLLNFLGRLAPKRNVEMTQQMLVAAGEPGHLTALDFFGVRLLVAVAIGVAYFLLFSASQPFTIVLRNGLIFAALGFFLPTFWLRRRAHKRQNEISRALPDALDMLTIGVEAGLAFESALLKVGERWENALTREFRRAVAEMRVGTPRDVALKRMADRSAVQELSTFVAVLIQSNRLGVSIADVLHSQAADMRVKRYQMAEERARQAGIKMVFPLVFLIFPAMFVVILGPSVPALIGLLTRMRGG